MGCEYKENMSKPGGVFCLETSWADDGKDLTDKASVEPQLRMLEGLGDIGSAIHRDVATRPEFNHYMREWLKAKYRDKYPIAYLAFHGYKGGFCVGNEDVSLSELAQFMGPKARGRIIYVGACSTMAAPTKELQGVCKHTDARAIVGYTRQVSWRESAAFDCLLIPRLLEMTNIRSAYNSLVRDYSDLTRILGLRMASKAWATDAKIARAADSDQ
mgnify:CR=1 FL=1